MAFFKTGVMAALIAGLMASGAIAQSQSTNRVAAKTDWSVFEENDPRECWAVSTYKESVNTQGARVVGSDPGRHSAVGVLPSGQRGSSGQGVVYRRLSLLPPDRPSA